MAGIEPALSAPRAEVMPFHYIKKTGYRIQCSPLESAAPRLSRVTLLWLLPVSRASRHPCIFAHGGGRG